MSYLEQQAWLWVEPCISCGAEVGDPCVTMSGHTPGIPTMTHAERLYIALAKRGNAVGVPTGGFLDVVDR